MYGVHVLDQVYGAAPQVVRRLRGTRWARPRGLFFEVNANTTDTALAQDGGAACTRRSSAPPTAAGARCIAYARTRQAPLVHPRGLAPPDAQGRREPGRVRLAVDPRGRGVVAWATPATPSVSRLQWLKPGRGVTRPRPSNRRGCPPFPR